MCPSGPGPDWPRPKAGAQKKPPVGSRNFLVCKMKYYSFFLPFLKYIFKKLLFALSLIQTFVCNQDNIFVHDDR